MMKLKKIFILALLFCPLLMNAQKQTMMIEKDIHCVNDSQDARINKVDDGNGNLCALLKITLSDPSQANSFHAVPGGYMAVRKSTVEPNTGELWYWLPANIQSLTFTCADHEPYKINVKLESGKVYRMSIQVQSKGMMVVDPDKRSDYIKFNVSPSKVRVYWGEDTSYKEFSDVGDDGFFSTEYIVDFGKTIYMKIVPEDKLCQPYETSFVWNGQAIQDIHIKESSNKISVKTVPDNADVFVDGVKITDLSAEKFPMGKHRLTVKKYLWYPVEQEIELNGDGTTKSFSFELKPHSAMATITCPDSSAELFIDEDKTSCGKGTVEIRLSSGTHKISSRRTGYATQAVTLTVQDGVDCSCQVAAPVALYGFVNIMTDPKGCEVYVDGQKVGVSPMMHKCLAGEHNFELKKDGYATKKQTVKVEYNETKLLNEVMVVGAAVGIGAGGVTVAVAGGESNSSLPQGFENAVNLSVSGTANCYIVSKEGVYKFNAKVKGGSKQSLYDTPVKAEVLWESFGTDVAPKVGDIISSVSYSNGYVLLSTPSKLANGNAVIAVKNSKGTILWSWHIWVCKDFDPVKTAQVYKNNAGTMMDRNLGATSATPGDVHALGLLYQWGRKDPFLSGCRIGYSYESCQQIAASTITWTSGVKSSSSTGTIAYAVAHPTTFIRDNDSNLDWYYTGSSSTDNTRWQTSDKTKGVYDPCPPGWRVPDGGGSGVWSTAFGSSSYYKNGPRDSTNKGMNFGSGNGKSSSKKLGSSSTIWFPASGYRHGSDGSLYYVGYGGSYWSCTPDGYYACNLYFYNFGYVYPFCYDSRATGSGVRCIKEK